MKQPTFGIEDAECPGTCTAPMDSCKERIKMRRKFDNWSQTTKSSLVEVPDKETKLPTQRMDGEEHRQLSGCYGHLQHRPLAVPLPDEELRKGQSNNSINVG